MDNSELVNFCCNAHNDAYIGAREKARLAGEIWTPEEQQFLEAITNHRAELRLEREKGVPVPYSLSRKSRDVLYGFY